MLNPDIWKKKQDSVDPDQLASKKPGDQDPHWSPLILYAHANNWKSAI